MKELSKLNRLLNEERYDYADKRRTFNMPDNIYKFKGKSNGLDIIGNTLFGAKHGIAGSIVIPDGVTEIVDFAFEDCSSLSSIIIPKSVTKIGIGAFYRCSRLTNITLPASVTKIDGMAFCRCTSLSSIIIPDGVTEIWEHAFFGCSSLRKVSLPKKVKLGIDVFYKCPANLEIEYRD